MNSVADLTGSMPNRVRRCVDVGLPFVGAVFSGRTLRRWTRRVAGRWTSEGWNWHGRGVCRDFMSRYIGPSTVVVATCEHGGAAADTVLLGALGLVASVQANTGLLMAPWTSLRVWER